MTRKVELLPIDEIVIPPGGSLDNAKVRELAGSIQTLGLMTAISVRADKRLICGRHRLAAHELLERKEIACFVVELSDLEAELATIDENLVRRELPGRLIIGVRLSKKE